MSYIRPSVRKRRCVCVWVRACVSIRVCSAGQRAYSCSYTPATMCKCICASVFVQVQKLISVPIKLRSCWLLETKTNRIKWIVCPTATSLQCNSVLCLYHQTVFFLFSFLNSCSTFLTSLALNCLVQILFSVLNTERAYNCWYYSYALVGCKT